MTTSDGWQHAQPPFHAGELVAQGRFGLIQSIDAIARRIFRDFLTEDQRIFCASLPFIAAGTTDDRGRIWANVFTGDPGFVSTPDRQTLRIATSSGWTPPWAGTDGNAAIGLLAIDLATRMRIRINGQVQSADAKGFTVQVNQGYPNCPQYIQTRKVDLRRAAAPTPPVHAHFQRLGDAERRLVGAADSMFIASGTVSHRDVRTEGNDVSYRGGKPGFVRVDDASTLTIPDFVGNFVFNTIGNILQNPAVGLLFVDFEAGTLLHLTGTAEVIWDGPEVKAFAGVQRLLRFTLSEGVRIENGWPFRWTLDAYSPVLLQTGSWADAEKKLQADRQRDKRSSYRIARIVQETKSIKSFHLIPDAGGSLPLFEAGQFLPVEVPVDTQDGAALRMYSLSDAPNATDLRITVKRVVQTQDGRPGLASNWLHDHAQVGALLTAAAPRGSFTPEFSNQRPLALISVGIGVTPMMAILREVFGYRQDRTRHPNRVHFIHGVRNSEEQAFRAELSAFLSDHAPGRKRIRYAELHAHVRFSNPCAHDVLGRDHHSVGRVDFGLVQQQLPPDDYDYFLCGPESFVTSLQTELIGAGVSKERVHTELFMRSQPPCSPMSGVTIGAHDRPVSVTFARSGRSVEWDPQRGTLLDLAEAQGFAPPFGCRVGACGVCAVPLLAGRIVHPAGIGTDVDDSLALICCALPAAAQGTDPPCISLDL